MSSSAKAHQGLAFLTLAVGIVAFFLAGLGAFGEGFDAHRGSGSLVILLSLIVLVLAFVGRREAVVQSAVLLGLAILQMLLAILGSEVSSFFGALHPINGLLILFVAHQTARALPLPFVGGGEHAAPRTRTAA